MISYTIQNSFVFFGLFQSSFFALLLTQEMDILNTKLRPVLLETWRAGFNIIGVWYINMMIINKM